MSPRKLPRLRTVCAMSFVLLTMPLLTACDPRNSSVAVKVVCPWIAQYDKATQDRALVEYQALPAGSAIKLMFGDYKHLRDRIRACQKPK
jgi:hypothetical protein